MPRHVCLIALACCFAVGVAIAGDAKITQVFDPPRLPDDSRLRLVRHLDNAAPFAPNFKDQAAWEKRAKELREQVLVANGLWPLPAKTPLTPVIHGKIERDDYTVEKVFFASYPGHYVSGNLYRPKGRAGKLPAVLCPHGHLANGRLTEENDAHVEREIKIGAEKTKEGARYITQAKCAMLARLGCVVFHYDMVGVADSKQFGLGHTHGFADVEAELRLQNFMGLQTWNSIRALDFLTSLPDVDPRRIAVTGHSGGGTQTFILCAVDDRPAVSFPAVMVSTAMQGGCICENASHLRVGTNNIELAALFAPKPQAMTGADDWTVAIETKGLPELKRIYGLYGKENLVAAKYFKFPHNYNQPAREMLYNWLNTHLKLGHEGTIVEKPFVPVPPKELSVYDAEHPRPSDATDAKGLRKHLTETSDLQLADLAKNPEEYRRVVGTALRVLIHDRAPETAKVQPTSFKEIKTDAFTVHQATVRRQGTEETFLTVGLIPKNHDGTIVIWVHPEGKASLLDAGGKPVPAAQKLLDKGYAIMAPDVFLTGEFHEPGKPTPAPWQDQKYHQRVPFAGYFYGYNRSLLANRVHDLAGVISLAGMAKKVHLIAFDKAGPWALMALAVAGDKVGKAAIDLNGFDFDQIKDVKDEMMLPGALKYGGIYGLVPLCAKTEIALFNARKTGQYEMASRVKGITMTSSPAAPEQLAETLLKQ